jgi:cytoskeletal protein RodZ
MSSYSEDQGFFEKLGEFFADHGRTIVSIIVVAILVGTGIYAYTRDGADDGMDERIEELASQDEDSNESAEGETDIQTESPDIASASEDNPAKSTETTPSETEIIRVDEQSNDITAKAGQGDGVTHLAREAVERYISDNAIEGIQPGHRVYMETTLKNKYYQDSLEVDQEITFTGSDLAQVVADAQNLNEVQLASWAYYAQFIDAY